MVKAESFSQTEKNNQQIHLFLFQFMFILRIGRFLSLAQVVFMRSYQMYLQNLAPF